VTLAGIGNVEEARLLSGTFLLARRSDLPDDWLPEPGIDPVGLSVTDVERGSLGTVVDTIATGANDVWVVAGGSVGEVLIPVIEEVILSVDEDRRTVQVRLLPGLIDET
jgi:16S rRNA processing protein RimM